MKDELLNLINDKDYDVIALTEIYPKNIVDSNVSDIEWKIKGYKEFISPSDIATRCTVYVKILKLFSYICSVCWSD
jgi:hypothetical protein